MANGINLKREKEEKGGCRILRLISKAPLDVTASQPPLVAQGVRWILYVGPVRSRSFPFLSVCCRDGTRASDGRAIVLIHHHNNLIFQIIACFCFSFPVSVCVCNILEPSIPSHLPPPSTCNAGTGNSSPSFAAKLLPSELPCPSCVAAGAFSRARARAQKTSSIFSPLSMLHRISHTHLDLDTRTPDPGCTAQRDWPARLRNSNLPPTTSLLFLLWFLPFFFSFFSLTFSFPQTTYYCNLQSIPVA